MDIAVQSLLAVLSGTHRKIRTRLARQKRSAVFAGHTQTRTHTPHTSRGHHESTTPSRTRHVTSHGQTTERVSAGFSPAKAHPRHKRCLKHKLNRGECDAEPPLASHSDPFLDWDCSSRITTVTLALGVTHAIRLAKEFRSFEGTPRLCFHRGCCRIRWRITSPPLPLHGATTCLFQPVRSQFHVPLQIIHKASYCSNDYGAVSSGAVLHCDVYQCVTSIAHFCPSLGDHPRTSPRAWHVSRAFLQCLSHREGIFQRHAPISLRARGGCVTVGSVGCWELHSHTLQSDTTSPNECHCRFPLQPH